MPPERRSSCAARRRRAFPSPAHVTPPRSVRGVGGARARALEEAPPPRAPYWWRSGLSARALIAPSAFVAARRPQRVPPLRCGPAAWPGRGCCRRGSRWWCCCCRWCCRCCRSRQATVSRGRGRAGGAHWFSAHALRSHWLEPSCPLRAGLPRLGRGGGSPPPGSPRAPLTRPSPPRSRPVSLPPGRVPVRARRPLLPPGLALRRPPRL